MEKILLDINNKLEVLDNKLTNIEHKIENLEKKLDGEIITECKKMGYHINFVENIYDNVKYPLGYINNKIKNLIGKTEEQYSLTTNEYEVSSLKDINDINQIID